MTTTITITSREESLYVAYAPELNVSAYGGCRDEAMNNLTDEIHQRKITRRETREERK